MEFHGTDKAIHFTAVFVKLVNLSIWINLNSSKGSEDQSVKLRSDKSRSYCSQLFFSLVLATPYLLGVWVILYIFREEHIDHLLIQPLLLISVSLLCSESSSLPRRPPLEVDVCHARQLVALMSRSELGSCAFASVDHLLRQS